MLKETFNKISSKEIKKEFSVVKGIFDKASNMRDGLQGCDDERSLKELKASTHLETKAEQNCDMYAEMFNIDYGTIINLVFDYDDTLEAIKTNLNK